MQFEHIVLVCDPSSPLPLELGAEHIWLALVHRAENPLDFNENLTEAAITERGFDYLCRELRFGSLIVTERVEMHAPRKMIFHTAANDQHQGGQLTLTVETPAPATLAIRFCYDTPLRDDEPIESGDASNAYYASYVKEAYRQSDLETVQKLLEWLVTQH